MTIYIGIDLSTDMKNTGIAVLCGRQDNAEIFAVQNRWCGTVVQWSETLNLPGIGQRDTFTEKAQRISQIVSNIVNNNEQVTVAIDVPFGWPVRFNDALNNYEIGEPFGIPGQGNDNHDHYFYRYTERVLMNANPAGIPGDPFSVSTDKIGRTAMLGSIILHNLTNAVPELGFRIQLYPRFNHERKIIEVYPTACAFALSNQEPNGNFSLRNFYNQQMDLNLPDGARLDKYDAIMAAYTAHLLETVPDRFNWNYPNIENLADDGDTVRREGWIWAPYRNSMAQLRDHHLPILYGLLQNAQDENRPRGGQG